MTSRSFSIEDKSALEQEGTTDISVLSMQLLEKAQEKMLNARHWPRYLPLPGFLSFTPCYSKVVFPYLRSAAWDNSSQNTALFFQVSSRGYPSKWCLVPQASFNVITAWLEYYPPWEGGTWDLDVFQLRVVQTCKPSKTDQRD